MSWEQIDDVLVQLADDVLDAVYEGIRMRMKDVQDEAQATDAYKNVTGALRASTLAFVVQGGWDWADPTTGAIAAAEQRNPDFVFVAEHEDPPMDVVAAYLTAYTAYAHEVATRGGAEEDFLLNPLLGNAGQLFDSAVAVVSAVYEGADERN